MDVDVNIKKGDWKAKHDSMLDAIKEAKKTRPPSAKKDIEVQIVVKWTLESIDNNWWNGQISHLYRVELFRFTAHH